MARDATIVLQNLECVSQRQFDPLDPFGGGQDPYIWPVLVWLDDVGFGSTSLFLGESRLVLQSGMQPGETADIHYPLGTLSHRFENVSIASRLLLVVVTWLRHSTPDQAVWAGCKALSTALPAVIQTPQNLFGLMDPDPAVRAQAIERVKQAAADRVGSAISDALSWEDKLAVAMLALRLDAEIGADYYLVSDLTTDLTTTDITLTMSDDFGNSYTVHGGLRVTSPAIDVCQAQADQVTAKQTIVDGIDNEISGLQARLAHAAPAEKPYLAADIARANADRTMAQTHLDDAKAALKECRDHWTKVLGAIPEALGTPISPTS